MIKKPTNLELSPEAMQQMGEAAVKAVSLHISNLPHANCSNLENGDQIVKALRESSPENGMDFESILNFFMNKAVPVSLNTPHPAYMAFIPAGGLYPAAIGDFLGAATNRYSGCYFAAPALVRLETNVLEWFASWMGYPETARGIFTTGGSLANFSAIVTARRHLLGDNIEQGTIYTSDQAHHCVMKSAILAGIAEKNIRILPSSSDYRADPQTFEKAIQADLKSGLKPFLLIGSAGTTNTGAIDPLFALADIAKKYHLWYHLDAAYGGFFNLCQEGRKKLAGIELSDSLVLDPHKGLFLPYGSGCLLVKEGECLRRAHTLTADYMQDYSTPEGEVNPSDYSPELTRSFHGLRVWLPLKYFGVKAFRENLEEKLRLTTWMQQKFLEEPGFEIVAKSDLSVIPFRYRPKRGDVDTFNQELLKNINHSKKLLLSSTLLHGEFILRVCILSFRTHQKEVEEAFDIITATAKNMEKNG